MNTVQVVWLRGKLTELAKMSLASYLRHGCRVVIWSYAFEDGFHPDVEVRDAGELLPESVLESYRFGPDGQMALACDRLSWMANYRHGGWMGHLDVTLLRPLPDRGPYVFGPHHRFAASFALWKAPANSPLVYKALSKPVAFPIGNWHTMMAAFSEAVERFDLEEESLVPDLVNDDGDEAPVRSMLLKGSMLPDGWEGLNAIHWMGSGTIRGRIPEDGSYYEELRIGLGVNRP